MMTRLPLPRQPAILDALVRVPDVGTDLHNLETEAVQQLIKEAGASRYVAMPDVAAVHVPDVCRQQQPASGRRVLADRVERGKWIGHVVERITRDDASVEGAPHFLDDLLGR